MTTLAMLSWLLDHDEPSIKPEELRFVITKIIDGNTCYLRYCSTTGEPLWEDKLTRDTELFRSRQSAWNEVNNYFLKGVFKHVTVKGVPLERIPTEPVFAMYFSDLPR